MTCRGYDPRAVKIGKPVKVLAATVLDNHERGAFIRSYVKVVRDNAQQRDSRREKK
jgi:hypothetical protein